MFRSFALVVGVGLVMPAGFAVEEAPKLAEKYKGQKVLVEFRRPDEATEEAIKKAKATVVEKVSRVSYLLDFGKEAAPHEAVAALPGFQGAIIFEDGKFKESIAYKNRRGGMLVPQDYACLRWGSNENAMKEMEADIEKFSKLPGIKAEKINTNPGGGIIGNPWMLKLTPEKDKTLLEVFLATKAMFDVVEVKDPPK